MAYVARSQHIETRWLVDYIWNSQPWLTILWINPWIHILSRPFNTSCSFLNIWRTLCMTVALPSIATLIGPGHLLRIRNKFGKRSGDNWVYNVTSRRLVLPVTFPYMKGCTILSWSKLRLKSLQRGSVANRDSWGWLSTNGSVGHGASGGK